MEKEIKQLIVEKEYLALTLSEKEQISEWATNKEEFDALKMTFISAQQLVEDKQNSVNPTIKEQLDAQFSARHKVATLPWYKKFLLLLWPENIAFYRKPALQLIAVLAVVLLALPYFKQGKNPQLAMSHLPEDRNNTSSKQTPTKEDRSSDLSNKTNKKRTAEKVKQEEGSEMEMIPEKDNMESASSEIIKEKLAQTKMDNTNGKDSYESSIPAPPIEEEQNFKMDSEMDEIAQSAPEFVINESTISVDKSLAKNKDKSGKTVSPSETLGFLTALY